MVKQDFLHNDFHFRLVTQWFCFIFCSNNGINPIFCCLYSYRSNNNKSGIIIVTDKQQYISREQLLGSFIEQNTTRSYLRLKVMAVLITILFQLTTNLKRPTPT